VTPCFSCNSKTDVEGKLTMSPDSNKIMGCTTQVSIKYTFKVSNDALHTML
jgi:hypothetical protein